MLGRLIARYAAPAWPLVVAVVLFQAAQSVAALLLPALNARIIDEGVLVGDIGAIWGNGAAMLALSLVQICCTVAAAFAGARLAMQLGRDLRHDLFGRVVRFSQREIGAFGAPSLITRNTNDVQQVQMLVQSTATAMISAPMMAIGGIVFAVRQDAGLSWLMAISVPVLVVFVVAVTLRMLPAFRLMQVRIDRVNRILREQLTGIRVVRAFVRENEERRRFAQASVDLRASSLTTGNLMALMFPVVTLVLNVSSVAVIWFGAAQVQAGDTQVGTLVAFLNYLMQILMGVMMASLMLVMIPRAAVCARRIGDVLDTVPSVLAPAAPAPPPAETGRIVFDDVHFSYPGADEPVLRGVGFVVEPGTTTAVIGSTGAGKSTLVSLPPRLFDVTGGSVRLDGVDVREFDPAALRARIGLVPQRAFLFAGTVASNLRDGDPDASDEQLWDALEIAQAREFVAALPGGLQTPVAQGGTNLSGGQRQRLAIARAVVKRPSVYIFDDSFSALDMRTDAALRRALDDRLAGSTRLIVGQRISSIQSADQIVVLEHGRIVGLGTHDQLARENPTYREILESQLRMDAA